MYIIYSFVFLTLVLSSSSLSAKPYEQYQVDFTPLDSWPKMKKKFMALRTQALSGGVTESLLKENMLIIEAALKVKKNANWEDGLWMKASGAFQLALSLDPVTSQGVLSKSRMAVSLSVRPTRLWYTALVNQVAIGQRANVTGHSTL